MATENRTLYNYGRAGNDAGGNITIGQQHIDQRKETNIDAGPTSIVFNIHFQSKTVLRGPRLVPANPTAAFLDQRLPLASGRGIIYDDRLGQHVSVQKSLHLTSCLCDLWNQTQPVINQLNSTLSDLYTSPHRDSAVDCLPSNDPLEGKEFSIRDKLVKAIRCSNNVYTTRSSISSYLFKIRDNLECYVGWIRLLPCETGTLCLCEVFEHVLSELLDDKSDRRVDPVCLRVLAYITNAFASAEDYMELYTSRRLTISLHQDTVYILWALVLLLQELVIYTWSRTESKEGHKQQLDALAKPLEVLMEEANMKAKTTKRLTPPQELGQSRGNCGLDVVRSFSNFLTAPTATGIGEHNSKLDKLIRYLAYDATQSAKDIERLALPKEMENDSLNKLAGLTRRTEFQDWLQEDKKTASLLVQGRLEHTGAISPLSHLCARYPSEYLRRGQKGIVFLHYFCSLQSNHRGRLADACDLARSLTAQLITNPQLASCIDVSSLSPKFMREIREGDLEQTMVLLGEVLDQVSNESVAIFCFIDSISVYETRSRRQDTLQFFDSLCSFLEKRRRRRERHKRMVFKLLVTEAGRTNYVFKYFRRPGETLSMY
ncbi:hypothetical protein F4818DRAFT_431798 [Hypoxylon cercidicola]|nr:hypothetical protein F4818DRAFT_431798 [Hypoxylon cercidicola]